MSQESPAPLLFADLGLSEPVMKAVAAVGYETPSPIQAATIGDALAGHDVLLALSGIGKVAAAATAAILAERADAVVMVGTAVTIDAMDAEGHFLGGLILPGVRMMCGALARNTAQLPHAEGEYREEPRNTMDAIVSGCLHAQAGAIERMFARVAAEGPALCLLTGGAAHRIAPCLGIPCRMEETLVLDGLLRCIS